MTRLQAIFADYEQVHLNRVNKVFHFIGIPMITLSVLGLFSHVVFWSKPESLLQLDLALCVVFLAVVRYVFLSFELAVSFLPVLLGFYFLGRSIPVPALWVLLVVGWIFQLAGHHFFEKKAPAFLQNFEHLIIGPLWIFASSVGWKFADQSIPQR